MREKEKKDVIRERNGFILSSFLIVALLGTIVVGGVFPLVVQHQYLRIRGEELAWLNVEKIAHAARLYGYEKGELPDSLDLLQNTFINPSRILSEQYRLVPSNDPKGVFVVYTSSGNIGSNIPLPLYDKRGRPISLFVPEPVVTGDEGGPFLPPGHGGTPPGHGGTPPGQGTPPGHGGIPPGIAELLRSMMEYFQGMAEFFQDMWEFFQSMGWYMPEY